MDNNINPYKTLGIAKDFTMQELKEAYKKMALQVHPDKGGTEYLFKLVTLCYRTLSKDYKKRHSEKEYNELKKDFIKNQSESQSHSQSHTNKKNININIDPSKGFNITNFNTIFDDNRIKTITDNGYGNFLKDGKDIEQKNIFENRSFSTDKFNRQFEKHTSRNKEVNKSIIKYKEPEALQTSKNMSFTELGAESIDDFSSDNTSRKNLNFMDLKIAHTTSRIIDPKTVEDRKQYKSVDELKSDRGNISYSLDQSEQLYYENKKNKEDTLERRRLENLLKTDNISTQQFERLNKLFFK